MKTDDAIYVIKSQPKTCDVFHIVKLKFQDISQEVALIFIPNNTTNITALGRRINSISRPPARLPVTETCNLVYLPVLVSGLTIHMQLQTHQNYDQGSSFVA